jgi:deoxyribonuclease-4
MLDSEYMPRLGVHVSIAGDLPFAVDRAVAQGCQAFQIFTKSAHQWRARRLPRDEIAEFRRKVEASGISPVVAHASYLINLGSPSGGC